MIKAFPYTNGRMYAEVRIAHHISSLDVVNALCLHHASEEEEPLPDLSASAVEKILRDVLKGKPDDRHWWQDGLEDDWCAELTEWAEELVRRRFPSFYGEDD